MSAKVVITTPFPTVRETAREMGVADKRVRLLRKLMTAIVGGAKQRVAAKRRVTKRKRATPR